MNKYPELVRHLEANQWDLANPRPSLRSARTYQASFHRVFQLGVLPAIVDHYARLTQHVADRTKLEIDKTLDGPIDASDPAFRAEFLRQLPEEERKQGERTIDDDDMIAAAENVDGLCYAGKSLVALEAIMAAMITGTWTAFEVLAGDLVEAAGNEKPAKVLALSGSKNRIGKRAGGAVRDSGEPIEGSARELGRSIEFARIGELTKGSFDMTGLWGQAARGALRFSTLSGIRESFSTAFTGHSEPIDKLLAGRELNALSAVRNLIVHKASFADDDYCRNQKGASPAPKLNPGERLWIDGELTFALIDPAITCGINLIKAVDTWLERA